jgi:DNA-binding response OmpR family regulator
VARGEAQDIEAGIAVGATNYMPKPFTPEELTARVALILAVSNDQPSA